MKTLTERFDSIIAEMRKRNANDETLCLFLINAVKQRDDYVIGEKEKKVINRFSGIILNEEIIKRNELREEQHIRAKGSL